MRQYIRLIAANPLFEGLDPATVEGLLDPCPPPAAYARGDLIFSPSQSCRALGFLTAGSALVYRPGGPPRVLMSRLGPGEVFGMASLFDAQPFPTEILAEGGCRVLLWDLPLVEAALAATPRLQRNYIALLSGRIRFLNRRLDALAGDSLGDRLLRLLAGLSGGEGAPFDLPLPLTRLAELLGVSRATLYRALDALEAAGRLRRQGRTLTLTDNYNEGGTHP